MGMVKSGIALYSRFIQPETCIEDNIFHSKLEGPLTQHHWEQHDRAGSTLNAVLR